MIKLVRTDSENKDFVEMVRQLDAFLAERNGNENSFYAQFNKIDLIKHVVIAYVHDVPVGCGAMKAFNSGTMEIKRMYTLPGNRGKGIATKVLAELEAWAHELSYPNTVLETGKNLPGAIGLYKKNGYTTIPNYGQYIGVENSVCLGKEVGGGEV